MNDDQALARMLERGWTVADLEEAAALHAAVERSGSLKDAARGLDHMRSVLQPEADVASPPGGWEAFEHRALEQPGRREASTYRIFGLWSAWAAVAAVTALAIVGWTLLLSQRPAQPSPSGPIAAAPGPAISNLTVDPAASAAAEMSPRDRELQIELFDRVTQVYDRRAAWVAVSGDEAEVGLGERGVADDKRLLVIRLTLSRAGQVVSRSDLAVVSGQSADLVAPLGAGRNIRYLVSSDGVSPGRLSVWVGIQTNGGLDRTIAALATELSPRAGDLINAGSMRASDGAYSLELGYYEVTDGRAKS